MTFDHLALLESLHEKPVFQWFLGALFVSLCEIWITVTLWKKYGRRFGPYGSCFSLADLLTFIRGFFVACVAGFLLLPQHSGWLRWLPGSLYIAAIACDCADGYFARRQQNTSEFGATLDRNFDGLTTLVGSLLAVRYSRLPMWYVSVGLAFYIFSFAAWMKQKSDGQPLTLPPSQYRRVAGGSNALFIGLALLPLPPRPWLSWIAPVLFIAIFWGFWRDWKHTSEVSAKKSLNHKQQGIRCNHSNQWYTF